MTGMDWQRLAHAIVDRRVGLGYKTREALLADIERTEHRLSRRVLADLETGRRENYDQATLARLEKSLEWPKGAVYRVLRGEEVETPKPEPRDIAAELMTASGVMANLFAPKMDLTDRIHKSRLGPEDRYELIREHRLRQQEFDRQELERIAARIEEKERKAAVRPEG